MQTAWQVALVAAGSAFGGVARWVTQVVFLRLFGAAFPWGTLFVNVSGSFVLGWFLTSLADRLNVEGWLRSDDLRLLVAVGFTGAFTTFSTFEYETEALATGRSGTAAFAYVAASVLLGLLAVRAGIALGRGQ